MVQIKAIRISTEDGRIRIEITDHENRIREFRNVVRLSISEELCRNGLMELEGFAVDDISDRKLENINWEVYDYENGAIHFLCEEMIQKNG